MKKYKRLEKYVENTSKPYENLGFLEKLKSEVEYKKRGEGVFAHKVRYILYGCVVGAVIATAILLCVFLINPDNNGSGIEYEWDKKYYNIDDDCVRSSVEEVNTYTEYIDLTGDNTEGVAKTIDTESGETLGFHLQYSVIEEKKSDYMEIHVVVNPNYHLFDSDTTQWKHTTFYGYELAYTEWTRPSGTEEGGVVYEGAAVIFTDKEIIFIRYDGYAEDGTNNMLGSITAVFELNN